MFRIPRHKLVIGAADVSLFNLGFLLALWPYVWILSGEFRLVLSRGEFEGHPEFFLTLFPFSLSLPLWFQLSGLYKYQVLFDRPRQLQLLTRVHVQIFIAFLAVGFVIRNEFMIQSRLLILLAFLITFFLTVVARCGVTPFLHGFLLKRKKLRKRVLIVGAGAAATRLVRELKENRASYFHVVGFCDVDSSNVGDTIEDHLILGTTAQLDSLIDRYRIQELIIATDSADHDEIMKLIGECKKRPCVIHVVSKLYGTITERLEVESFQGIRTFRIAHTRGNGIVRDAIKRLTDIGGAMVGLVVLAPGFLTIAVAIKLDSLGPVFYRRKVVGKDGKPFYFYKFRSMYNENSEKEHIRFMKDFISGRERRRFYLESDDRITRVGRFLRRYSIDELPQLWNVLKGEMSLVGPRPCSVEEFEFYKDWHKTRLSVKPGITGLWQVRGRSQVMYDEMVAIDMYYIENQSFWLDLETLLRTIPVVLRSRGSRV